METCEMQATLTSSILVGSVNDRPSLSGAGRRVAATARARAPVRVYGHFGRLAVLAFGFGYCPVCYSGSFAEVLPARDILSYVVCETYPKASRGNHV